VIPSDFAKIRWRPRCPEITRAHYRRAGLRYVFAGGGHAGKKLREALAKIGVWKLEIIKRTDTAKGSQKTSRRQ
jgi:hypothetical protein